MLFTLAMVVRKIATHAVPSRPFIRKEQSLGDLLLLFLDGIGMLVPFIYIFTNRLNFANYSLPNWIGWTGVLLFIFAIGLLYRSHKDLGKNWSAIIGVKSDHKLIIHGAYKYIRHPMYAAHIVWAIAQIMMLHNWIAGFSFIIPMCIHYLIRSKREERLLLIHFGDDYREYMLRTGSIIPKLK